MHRWLRIYGLGINSAGIILLCGRDLVMLQLDDAFRYLGMALVVVGAVMQMLGIPKVKSRLYAESDEQTGV